MNRLVCVAIHDVAPSTWPACRRLISLVKSFGVDSLTLLVVPDYHHRGEIDRDPRFIAEIDALIADGAEPVLHGYYHLDEAQPPRTLAQLVRRRLYTAAEGEFAALDADQAAARIQRGQRLMTRIGWTVQGFAAPAWLSSRQTRAALRRSSLGYFTTRSTLVSLAFGRELAAPTLTASARSAWRRTASRMWLPVVQSLTAEAALVRVGLHPADATYPEVMTSWHRILGQLLRTRTPMTKGDAIATLL